MTTVAGFSIRLDDLTGEQTRDLVRLHLAGLGANVPPEHRFALDLTGLQQPDIRLWTVWQGDHIAGMGALKNHNGLYGEIKSMRTHPDFLRQGVGAVILDFIISQAREMGLPRLSLETGVGEAFTPAIALYCQKGFVSGAPFADYAPSPFSSFFHLDL
jgi:putative acetyltransferase